jgi:hypothetical protein
MLVHTLQLCIYYRTRLLNLSKNFLGPQMRAAQSGHAGELHDNRSSAGQGTGWNPKHHVVLCFVFNQAGEYDFPLEINLPNEHHVPRGITVISKLPLPLPLLGLLPD